MTFFTSYGIGHIPFVFSDILLSSLNWGRVSLNENGYHLSHWVVLQFLSIIFFPFFNICICVFFTSKWISHWLCLRVCTCGSPEKLSVFFQYQNRPQMWPSSKCEHCCPESGLWRARNLPVIFFLLNTFPPGWLVFSFVMGSSSLQGKDVLWGWRCPLQQFTSFPLCHRWRGMYNVWV